MYPYKIFLGLTLYDICLCLGLIACFFVFGFLADRHRTKRKIQNFALICGCGAIIVGYGSAVFFQALYNIKSLGEFVINANTGATFYGGLIGGVAMFLALYFGVGCFRFEDASHAKAFFDIADSAVPSIVIAHALGRIGCLTAGCCHGAKTSAWYGIMMHGNLGYAKYVPVQLFEAIFLLLLFAFLFIRSMDKKGYCLPIYLCVYAVWRFAVEFIRGDYRGNTLIDALSPSQLIACILFFIGIGLLFFEKHIRARLKKEELPPEEDNEKAE